MDNIIKAIKETYKVRNINIVEVNVMKSDDDSVYLIPKGKSERYIAFIPKNVTTESVANMRTKFVRAACC